MNLRLLLCGQEVPLFTVPAGGDQDVFPGRGRVPATKQSCGSAGRDVPGLLGERQTLAGPERVHPAEHQRLPAAAAGPAALPVHGLVQQRLSRLSVRKQNQNELSCTRC